MHVGVSVRVCVCRSECEGSCVHVGVSVCRCECA